MGNARKLVNHRFKAAAARVFDYAKFLKNKDFIARTDDPSDAAKILHNLAVEIREAEDLLKQYNKLIQEDTPGA